MDASINIRFRQGNQNFEIALTRNKEGKGFSVKGNDAALAHVIDYLPKLEQNSADLRNAAFNLKAHLWKEARARDIEIFVVHKTNSVGLGIFSPKNESSTTLINPETLVNKVCEELVKFYADKGIASKCADHLRSQVKNGKYNEAKDLKELTQLITKDLREFVPKEPLSLVQRGGEICLQHAIGLDEFNTIQPKELKEVVSNISDAFEKYYIHKEMGAECANIIRKKLAEGFYDGISFKPALTEALTADLRSLTEDKHITIVNIFTEPPEDAELPLVREEVRPSAIMPERYPIPSLMGEERYKWSGEECDPTLPYEMASGYLQQAPKVGYIDLRTFGPYDEIPDKDREKTIKMERTRVFQAALSNIQKAESIVIDLRNNGGGDPPAVQALCSLFLEPGLPLSQIKWREGDSIVTEPNNTFSADVIPLEMRVLKKPIVILTSSGTFSAAEAFTYDMKTLGRARGVGQISAGGANPVGFYPVGSNFAAVIPKGEAYNPVTGGNWEGTGVIPKELVPAENALEEALKLAG